MSQFREYLDRLFLDSGQVELRRICPDKSYNRFRWFDDVDGLWGQARQWAGDGIALFTTLNEPEAGAPRNRGLKDQAVFRYRRLLFDFDPERDKGCNSTAQQLGNAVAMRDDFVQRMHAMGWPEPVLAMSGNGAHAQYAVDIENTAENALALRDFYRGLAVTLKGVGVKFDPTTHNASRLCRLYGALNRKSPSQDGMPQRIATVEMPPLLRVVPDRALQLAMDSYRVQKPQVVHQKQENSSVFHGSGDYRTLDIVGWFQAKGLYLGHLEDNKHAVTCPWISEHTTDGGRGETLVYESSGDWAGFFCHHSHCESRRIQAVMELFGDADGFCREAFSK